MSDATPRSGFSRPAAIVAALYWLAMFTATHIPDPGLPPDLSDKVIHCGGYLGLYILLSLAVRARTGLWPSGSTRWRLAGLIASYGVFDEMTQAIPILRRTCDPLDMVADATGALLGILIVRGFATIETRFRKAQSRSAEA